MLYSYIFKMETRVIFFLNTVTFAFNFICKNKLYLKKEFPSKNFNLWFIPIYPTFWKIDSSGKK